MFIINDILIGGRALWAFPPGYANGLSSVFLFWKMTKILPCFFNIICGNGIVEIQLFTFIHFEKYFLENLYGNELQKGSFSVFQCLA